MRPCSTCRRLWRTSVRASDLQHTNKHRQHTLQGEGTQAGGRGVGVPECSFFEPGRPSQRGNGDLGAVSSKSASSYQSAGIRQASHVSVGPPPEQPVPPTGGDPGSTRVAGMGRMRGVVCAPHGSGPRPAWNHPRPLATHQSRAVPLEFLCRAVPIEHALRLLFYRRVPIEHALRLLFYRLPP